MSPICSMLTGEQVAELERFARAVGEEPRRRDREGEGDGDVLAAARGARHPARRRRDREADRAEVRHAVGAARGGAAKDSEAFVAELNEIEGVGDTIAEASIAFLRDPHVQRRCSTSSSRAVSIRSEPVVAVSEGPLVGKTFVVTGTLTQPRADVQKKIEQPAARSPAR